MNHLLGILSRGRSANFQLFKQALVYTHSKKGVESYLLKSYPGIFEHYQPEECTELYMQIDKGVLNLRLKCHLPALISDLRGSREALQSHIQNYLTSQGILRTGQNVHIVLI